MQRWTSLLGALMLVLTLWTGGAAHAAGFDCMSVPAEANGHFEDGQDKEQPAPDQNVAHQHSGCSGHHLTPPAEIVAAGTQLSGQLAPVAWRESGKPGRGPDSHLRPPIA